MTQHERYPVEVPCWHCHPSHPQSAASQHDGRDCRLYTTGQKLAEGATMAADASLPLERIAAALRAFFGMLCDPDTLPEFRAIQASPHRHVLLVQRFSYLLQSCCR